MKIICANERLVEKRGAKILIAGPSGVGKTSLLRTLDPKMLASTLLIDIEAGDLAVADLKVASVRPRRWEDCRNLACALGGPNPALPAAAPYSEAHYKVVTANTDLASLASYDTLFVDSLSAGSRLSFAWAEQQPEAFSDRGRKDLRAIYGLHALHYERSGPVWLLTLGGTVPADVAAIVIAHQNIAGVGDCLFANGPSQTWRWAE